MYSSYQSLSKKLNSLDGICKTTFVEFLGLPSILGERYFELIHKIPHNCLSNSEFNDAIEKANCSDINKILRTVFDLYDFDGNDLISIKDVKTMLYHTNSLRPYPYYKLRISNQTLDHMKQMYGLNIVITMNYMALIKKYRIFLKKAR